MFASVRVVRFGSAIGREVEIERSGLLDAEREESRRRMGKLVRVGSSLSERSR